MFTYLLEQASLLNTTELIQHWLAECCFTSTETVGLLGTEAQDGHLDFHTAPELRARH